MNACGVLMDPKLIPVHLKHIRDKHSRCKSSQSAVQTQAYPSRSVDSPGSETGNLAARLFALTLTDDGPDQNSTPSKLWESHGAHEGIAPGRHIVNGSPDHLSVSDVVESLSRLVLRDTTPSSCPPDHNMAPTPDPCSAPNITDSHSLSHITHHSPAPFPSSQNELPGSLLVHDVSNKHAPRHPASATSHGVAKKDTNRHSVKALELLSNIESHCQRCFRLMLDPSSASITPLQEELGVLRRALEGIKRNAPAMTSHKEEVAETLRKLDAKLLARTPPLPPPTGSLEFDNGEIPFFLMPPFNR